MRGEIACVSLLIGPRVNQSHSHPLHSAEVHTLPPELWAELIRVQSPARIALKNEGANLRHSMDRMSCTQFQIEVENVYPRLAEKSELSL